MVMLESGRNQENRVGNLASGQLEVARYDSRSPWEPIFYEVALDMACDVVRRWSPLPGGVEESRGHCFSPTLVDPAATMSFQEPP